MALTAVPLPPGMQQFCDANGAPLNKGLLYTLVPNSTNPKTTWQDPAQAQANANPITLDPAGRCAIWGSGIYRLQLFDALGNLVWDKPSEAADPNYVIAQIPAFVGDSGTGGTAGFVPAPPALSAAEGYYLGAGGVWGPLEVVVPAAPTAAQAGKLFVPVRQIDDTTGALQLSDVGGCVTYNNAGAGVLTISSDAAAGWVLGVMSQIMLYSFLTSGNLVLTRDTGVTLFWPGSSSTSANRTLAANGQCLLTRVGANFWTVVGTGLS